MAVLLRFLKAIGQLSKISLSFFFCLPLSSAEIAAPPPEFEPYTLPTFNGTEPSISTSIDAYINAPVINADTIFQRVLSCYPHKSKWKIDVELRGSLSNSDVFSETTGNSLGKNYVQIVASMPLYSAKEMDRSIKNEHDLRQDAAKAVAGFVQSIASRNHSLREIALYTSLEKRSSVRVKSGVIGTTEQVGYLEKVAKAHEANIEDESDIMTSRISLAAMCSGNNYELMNQYLIELSKAPK